MSIFSAIFDKKGGGEPRPYRIPASHKRTGKATFNPERKNTVLGYAKLHDTTHNKGRFGTGGGGGRIRHGNSGTRCGDVRHREPLRRIARPYTSRRDMKNHQLDQASFLFGGTLYRGHGIKKARRKLHKNGIPTVLTAR